MKLRYSLTAALAAGMLLFSACDQTPAAVSGDDTTPVTDFASVDMMTADISAPALAEHLLANVKFDDPNMAPLDGEIAQMLYNITGLCESAAAYGSTGATAEAVLVVKCATAENAAAAAEKIDTYRKEMAGIYASYNEPESVKLTRAMLSTDGVYVVFCVAPDPAAAETVYHSYVTSAVYGG